jgi:hypothetical protein
VVVGALCGFRVGFRVQSEGQGFRVHCKQIAEIMIGEDKLIHFSGGCGYTVELVCAGVWG